MIVELIHVLDTPYQIWRWEKGGRPLTLAPGEWLVVKVTFQAQRMEQLKEGEFVGMVPDFDVLLGGPNVFVLVDEERNIVPAIYVGAGAIENPTTVEALNNTIKFGRQVKDNLPPQDIAKASMGPVNIPLFVNRNKLPTAAPVLVAGNSFGAMEWKKGMVGKKLHAKDFRNEGKYQYLGGIKLSQNIGTHRTAKVGMLCFLHYKFPTVIHFITIYHRHALKRQGPRKAVASSLGVCRTFS